MKATARAHPIEGLVKYHGMRDEERRMPYHDSISLCTAPSATTTTVEFGEVGNDRIVIDGDPVEGQGRERVLTVVDHVRELAGVDEPAARAVTGAFSHLHTGVNDEDCRSERIPVDDGFEEDLRIVACEIPAFKHTGEAHAEAADSHMFQARMAHIHPQISDARDGLRRADFDDVFGLAEHDSLSLAATTMTGPAGWVYWEPETLQVFETVRTLRREEDVPVYFSVDTGASVYLNTTRDYLEVVQEATEDLGIDTRIWKLGGPTRVLDEDEALF